MVPCCQSLLLLRRGLSTMAAPPRLAALRETLQRERKPSWLKVSGAGGPNYERLRSSVRSLKLATVCEEARCPNIGECWEGGEDATATATVMIMGDECTRGCRFCSVKTSRTPRALDRLEPANVARAVAEWGLDYVVVTCVDRDDLPDQGAAHIAETVAELKKSKSELLVEVLCGDFQGRLDLVDVVATSGLEVFAHNLETVEKLTPRVRDRRAGYRQSLKVLEQAAASKVSAAAANGPRLTKTSLMLGLGETDDQVMQALTDCRTAGVDVITFGQYLRPTKRHLPVSEYVTPAKFDDWKARADAMGFVYVASGPLVRSSYKAGELYVKNFLLRGGNKNNNFNFKTSSSGKQEEDDVRLAAAAS
mmetsp:Transcript_13768/g.44897  ORF Transcript_13768/g.44897 Transcript_13768/m.44897 type:complete len:364 (+) Transcript_13768:122-1213(+)